jgi:hypothetical protein
MGHSFPGHRRTIRALGATATIIGSANSTEKAKRFMVPSLPSSDAVPTGNRVGGPLTLGGKHLTLHSLFRTEATGERLMLNVARDPNVAPA